MLSQDELNKIRERAKAWASMPDTELYGDRYFSGPHSKAEFTKAQEDAYLSARTDIPALLEHVGALQQCVEGLLWYVEHGAACTHYSNPPKPCDCGLADFRKHCEKFITDSQDLARKEGV